MFQPDKFKVMEICRKRKDIKEILYTTFVRPHLEYAAPAWSPYRKKEILTLERIQRRATKLVRQFKNLSYEEGLVKLNLTTLEKRRDRGDLIQLFKTFLNINTTKRVKLYLTWKIVHISFLSNHLRGVNFYQLNKLTTKHRLTSLKHNGGFLRISSMAHLTVLCRILASCSIEDAVPAGVPRDLS